jgi:hypothetical protein
MSDDLKKTKRERATDKLINLKGAVKGTLNSKGAKDASGAQGFSFRFSPESEEIQEILTSSVSAEALPKLAVDDDTFLPLKTGKMT